jgi:hypothetical protein
LQVDGYAGFERLTVGGDIVTVPARRPRGRSRAV